MKHKKLTAFLEKLLTSPLNKGPALAWVGAFFLCLTMALMSLNSNRSLEASIREFEVGRVAERDVIAEQTIVYIDEYATRLRIEAQERLVPAVFRFSHRVTEDQRNRWYRFSYLASRSSEDYPRDTFKLAIQSEFPGEFSDDVLEFLYENRDHPEILLDSAEILNLMLEKGIFSIPDTGLERLNPNFVELIRESGPRIEQERVSFGNIINYRDITGAMEAHIPAGSYAAPKLLKPFLTTNVIFSPEATTLKIAEVRANTEPVTRTIEQGTRVIKRGFIITEEEMIELRALRMAIPGIDLHMIVATTLFLLMLFVLLLFFSGKRIIGRNLLTSEMYLVSGLSAFYIAGSVLLNNISVDPMPASVVFPAALVIMLPSILIHPRLALLLAMTLPLGAFLIGSFDASSFVFALVSGVVAAYSLRGTEKRMDLVKAGFIIAAANIVVMIAVLLWQHTLIRAYPGSLFWAAFNGIASGMLVLGVLPLLENAMNAATSFRLIELSDLNAPILRRLFTRAPGTYSHSILVANLAETACQKIGANHLLARVGAYFHDLGKMESPGHFVENQESYNCHDDMEPRLSATVIRSHVNQGVEKARQLGLPKEVIDIISEHHGDSLITWFYDKALKQELENTVADDSKKPRIEDYIYLGEPPHSRESAVVMLADMTEAAVRTMEKPTADKLEKFIRELISKKVEHGQLARSELTFRDLETIKNAFVQVLAGYYHSRIEYPKATLLPLEAVHPTETAYPEGVAK